MEEISLAKCRTIELGVILGAILVVGMFEVLQIKLRNSLVKVEESNCCVSSVHHFSKVLLSFGIGLDLEGASLFDVVGVVNIVIEFSIRADIRWLVVCVIVLS